MRLQNALGHQLRPMNLLKGLDEIERLLEFPQTLLSDTSAEDPLTNVVAATFDAAWEAQSVADLAAALRAAGALLAALSVFELVLFVALLDEVPQCVACTATLLNVFHLLSVVAHFFHYVVNIV